MKIRNWKLATPTRWMHVKLTRDPTTVMHLDPLRKVVLRPHFHVSGQEVAIGPQPEHITDPPLKSSSYQSLIRKVADTMTDATLILSDKLIAAQC